MREIEVKLRENTYHHGKAVKVVLKDGRIMLYLVRHIHQDGSGYEYAYLVPKIY